MTDIVERLRALANEHYEMLGDIHIELTEAASEIERLREALSGAKAWLDRWAQHVGLCRAGYCCTCGLTAIQGEVRTALEGK